MATIKKSASSERLLTTTITISELDQEYLDHLVATHKRKRRKTNRSELMAIGVALLRQKSPQEIDRLLGG